MNTTEETSAPAVGGSALSMDFTVIARGGLTQVEFAALVGVGRVTTNTWVRGRMQPHRFIKARIAAVLAHLESAIHHGDLPLPLDAKSPAARAAGTRAAIRLAVRRAEGPK